MQRSESAPYGSFTIDVEIYKPDLGNNKRSVFSASPKRQFHASSVLCDT
jgi:hypothetical protein